MAEVTDPEVRIRVPVYQARLGTGGPVKRSRNSDAEQATLLWIRIRIRESLQYIAVRTGHGYEFKFRCRVQSMFVKTRRRAGEGSLVRIGIIYPGFNLYDSSEYIIIQECGEPKVR
jgi:hypothetical protein